MMIFVKSHVRLAMRRLLNHASFVMYLSGLFSSYQVTPFVLERQTQFADSAWRGFCRGASKKIKLLI